MNCVFRQMTGALDECLDMEFNGTFNFSLNEAYSVLLERMNQDGNVDKQTEFVLITLYIVLMVSGLSANMIVSFVVARRPQMHTARNLYIVNLTVSDMALCVVCMPFTLITIIRRQWHLGIVMCKLVPGIQGTNIMVSIGTITVIALDRYFTIVRGQDAASNKSRVIISIALVWLLSALATLPVVFYQVVEPVTFQRVILYETCMERWPSQELKVSYAVFVLIVQAVIPALVVGVVHARIASYLHAHAKTQKDSRRAQRELHRNRRTTMLLSGIAILFATSWLPLGVFSLTADLLFPPEASDKVSSQKLYVALAACHILAMSSAVSNPVVYGWLNSNIRQELLQLLPSKCATGQSHRHHHNMIHEDHTTRTNIHTPTARRESVTILLQNGDKTFSQNQQPQIATAVL